MSEEEKEKRAQQFKTAPSEASSAEEAGAPCVIQAAQQPWSFSAIMVVY